MNGLFSGIPLLALLYNLPLPEAVVTLPMIRTFSLPGWKNAEAHGRALILTKGMMSVLFIFSICFIVAGFIQQEYMQRYALILMIMWTVSAALLLYLKETNVPTISTIYISFLLAMIFIFSWTGGGIKGHGISWLPIVVVFAGLTVGRRQIWIFGLVAGLGGLFLTTAHYLGSLPVTEPLGTSHMIHWIVSATCILALTCLEFLSIGRLQKSLDETKRELALRKESESNYRRIVESFQDVYYQTDMSGIITMITPSVKTRTGYDQHDLIGKNVKRVYANPVKRDEFLQILAAQRSVYNYDLDLITKSGEIVNVIASSRIIYTDDGKPVGIEGTLHDITERKKAEDHLRIQNEGLMEIAFLQSHIVRAPLTNILGLISLINKEDLQDPSNFKLIPQIESEAKQLDGVIHKVVQKTNEIRKEVAERSAKDPGNN